MGFRPVSGSELEQEPGHHWLPGPTPGDGGLLAGVEAQDSAFLTSSHIISWSATHALRADCMGSGGKPGTVLVPRPEGRPEGAFPPAARPRSLIPRKCSLHLGTVRLCAQPSQFLACVLPIWRPDISAEPM